MNAITFRNSIASQENEQLNLKDLKFVVKPNVAPEDSGGYDIGFGHKITREDKILSSIYGFPYIYGITKQDAISILEMDIQKHMIASRDFVGFERFESLPLPAQQLICDFSFTGTLAKFPKLFLSIFDRNLKGVMDNYKRYFTKNGERIEMKRRNEFALKLIEELKKEGFLR